MVSRSTWLSCSGRRPGAAGMPAAPGRLPEQLNQVERETIARVLAQCQFDLEGCARLLGISVRQLGFQMQRLNLPLQPASA